MATGVDPADAVQDQRFRAVADSAPAPVWMSEPSGGCTYFNRGLAGVPRAHDGAGARRRLGRGRAPGRLRALPPHLPRRARRRAPPSRWSTGCSATTARTAGSSTGARRCSPRAASRGWSGSASTCTRGVSSDERARLLADVVAALGEEAEIEERLQALAGLLAHRVGDLCAIDVADADGRLEMVANAARRAGAGARRR